MSTSAPPSLPASAALSTADSRVTPPAAASMVAVGADQAASSTAAGPAGHTPGPWFARRLEADGFVITKPGYEVVSRDFDVCANIQNGAPIRRAADAHVMAASLDMRDALRDLLAFFKLPGESENERFERIGKEFYRETGMLRPGKSEPMQCWYPGRDEDRQRAFDEWCQARQETARAALARAEGRG